jgi:hypothetical protein
MFARTGRWHAGRLDIAGRVRVPLLVAEAGSMSEQMLQRDRPPRGTQPRRTRSIEAFQDLRRAQGWVDIGHRVIEPELALLHQLHRGDRRHRFGHRRDAEHRIRRHHGTGCEVPCAEGAFVEDALVRCRHRHGARNLPRIDCLLKDSVYACSQASSTVSTWSGSRCRSGRSPCDRSKRRNSGSRLQQGTAVLMVQCHCPVLPHHAEPRQVYLAGLGAVMMSFTQAVQNRKRWMRRKLSD